MIDWRYKILSGTAKEVEVELNIMCDSPECHCPSVQGIAATDNSTTVVVYYGAEDGNE